MTDVIGLGNAAQRLLEDETMQGVWASLKAQYTSAWEAATIPEAREALWHRMKAIADVQTELRRLRDSGTRAQRTT